MWVLLKGGLTLARFVQYWIIIGPILGFFIDKFPMFDQYWSNNHPIGHIYYFYIAKSRLHGTIKTL